MRRVLLVMVLAVASLGCEGGARRLVYRSMRSDALRDVWAEYGVYLPPNAAEERLPLVVFLHGGGDGPDAWDRHGIAARLDRAVRAGAVPRAIVVVPQGDLGFWANWYDGSRLYENWVTEEVMPAVQRRFRTLPCPAGCFLMGVSMGAEGAIRIAMHKPGLFAGVISISGPSMDTDRRLAFMNDRAINILVPTHHIFGPDEPRSRVEADDPFVRWRSQEDLRGMRLFLAWARSDRPEIIEGGQAFEAHLVEHGIAHEHRVFEGGHDWTSWGPVIEEALATELAAIPLAATRQ